MNSSGKLVFYTLINGFNFDSVTGSTILSSGVWYHVAGVWNGTTLKVFVNGVQVGSKSSTFAPGTGTSDVFIGRGGDGSGYFNGLIDKVRITADAIYTSNFTPQNRLTGVNGTKGLWRFDGQDVKDCANINHGINNGATFSTSVP